MSGPLLTAIDREGANPIRAFGNEVMGNPLVFPNELEERAGPETSADDHPANPVSDVNQPVDNFDHWRFFEKNRRVQRPITFKHSSDPTVTLTRQAKCGPERMTASLTCGSKTAQNFQRFQWVPKLNPAFRRTVVINPTQPANDRGWHPFDAA